MTVSDVLAAVPRVDWMPDGFEALVKQLKDGVGAKGKDLRIEPISRPRITMPPSHELYVFDTTQDRLVAILDWNLLAQFPWCVGLACFNILGGIKDGY